MKQKYVGAPVRKRDAMALVTGQPVYTADIAPAGCLVVKLLRSPHASAVIREIRADAARRAPGIACVLTWRDVPQSRFTTAGQTWPEPSPYDRLILDRRIRCAGDPVAIVAGETEAQVDAALRLIKVEYDVQTPLLDFTQALDNPILVHPEPDFRALCDVGADNKRNLCAQGVNAEGDVDAELAKCEVVIDQTYNTLANNQTMMETFRAFAQLDAFGRLVVTSSTQVPFHVRRILSNALELPKSRIRVVKPRIGGGFGAKQTAVCEVYPAIVALHTGRPAMIVYSRAESMTNGSPRHQMQIHIRLGADRDGTIRAIDLHTLSNAGAYGEHGPTTVGLSGHKSIPLYGSVQHFRFSWDVVYTNTMGAGAYRGYGATQGIYALETAVNELAAQLGIDPTVLREKNMVREGQRMPAYYGEMLQSCALDRCMARAKQMIGWDEKYPARTLPNGHIRSVGVAMAMQGSSISHVDVAGVRIMLGDEGYYTLMIGATDMGTGCDTILAQMAADCLDCPLERITVPGVDTDTSPYDCGSYASSTTYLTGMAVVKAAGELREKILGRGAELLEADSGECEFDGLRVTHLPSGRFVTLEDIGYDSFSGAHSCLVTETSCTSPTSPPPFMVGIAEIDLDPETGKVEMVDYAGAVDCGTVVNANLARVQTEGGIVQGIGMALTEQVQYTDKGMMMNNSLMQYKIPTRLDAGRIRVEFEPSCEPAGPFGAKSIGELVINTPAPAITNAIYNATGLQFRSLPVTSEQIAMGLMQKRG